MVEWCPLKGGLFFISLLNTGLKEELSLGLADIAYAVAGSMPLKICPGKNHILVLPHFPLEQTLPFLIINL